MALLTAQQITVTGLQPVYAAVSASDTLVHPGGDAVFLHVKNAGGGADTVTLVVPGSLYGVAIADATVSVPATSGDRMILIPPGLGDPVTGLITVLHGATASVTCALLRL